MIGCTLEGFFPYVKNYFAEDGPSFSREESYEKRCLIRHLKINLHKFLFYVKSIAYTLFEDKTGLKIMSRILTGSKIIKSTFDSVSGLIGGGRRTPETPRGDDAPSLMSRRRFLTVAAGGIAAVKLGMFNFDPAYAQTSADYDPAIFRHPTLASNSTDRVGMRLVCLFDISGSIDTTEYEVQRAAMRDAIASEDFRNAIFFRGGPQSIAVCVADFGSTTALRIPWLDIRAGDDTKLQALASEINGLQRRESGSTHQSRALDYSGACLANCPWEARRSVVDMITDGKENEFYGAAGEARIIEVRNNLARQHQATVNALVTVDPSSSDGDLEDWARRILVTPPTFFRPDGSLIEPGFVKVVAFEKSEENQKSIIEYHKAMELAFRRKLILEVANLELEELQGIAQAGGLGIGLPRALTPPFQ